MQITVYWPRFCDDALKCTNPIFRNLYTIALSVFVFLLFNMCDNAAVIKMCRRVVQIMTGWGLQYHFQYNKNLKNLIDLFLKHLHTHYVSGQLQRNNFLKLGLKSCTHVLGKDKTIYFKCTENVIHKMVPLSQT